MTPIRTRLLVALTTALLALHLLASAALAFPSDPGFELFPSDPGVEGSFPSDPGFDVFPSDPGWD